MSEVPSADSPEIRQAQERLSWFSSAIPQIVWTATTTGEVEYLNDYIARFTGVPDARFYREFVHPDDLPRCQRLWRESLRLGVLFESECRLRRADGEYVWFLNRGVPIRADSGEIEKWIGVTTDIDHQKQAQEVQRFLAQLNEILSGPADTPDMLQRVVALCARRFDGGGALHLLQGERLERVVCVDEPGLEPLFSGLSDSMGPKQVQKSGKGEWIPRITASFLRSIELNEAGIEMLLRSGVSSYLSVPLVSRGKTQGTFTLFARGRGFRFEDFKLAEKVAARVSVAIENARLFQDRQDLLAVVSHDLKNPLHTIQLKTRLLMKLLPMDPGLEPARKLADGILRSSDRMERLIQDLLDLSRIEDGHLNLEKQPVAFGALLEESAEMLVPLAMEKGVTIATDRLPDARTVSCDRERIGQVLSNLLGNAIKFTSPGGQIRIHGTRGADSIQVEISDTGSGIRPEDMPHIFDRYWQARKTARYGTGLGLAIAKGIIEAHGGRIWAESRPGSGSRFTFRIPVA